MRELLPAFVADEVTADQRGLILKALRSSPELRHELERYQQLHVLLVAAAAAELSPPADLSSRIAQQVVVRFYLRAAFDMVGDLLGAYGAAAAFYAGLS